MQEPLDILNEITGLEPNVRGGYGQFSISVLHNFYKQGQLEIQPVFQRNYVVGKKTDFITELFLSIFQGWTINAIHLQYIQLPSGDFIYRVIDGQQRLKTIFNFLDGRAGISIRSLHKLLGVPESRVKEIFIKQELLNSPRRKRIKKITINNIKEYWKDKILSYKVDVFQYNQNTSLRAIIELFKRMNTHTTKLNDMEIRRAILYCKDYYSLIGQLTNEIFKLRNYYRKINGLPPRKFKDDRYNMMEILMMFDGVLFGFLNEKESTLKKASTPVLNVRNWQDRATLLDVIAENRKKVYENNPELKEEHMEEFRTAISNFIANIKQLYPNDYVLITSYYKVKRNKGKKLYDKGINANLLMYYGLILSKIKPKLLQKIATNSGTFNYIRKRILEAVSTQEYITYATITTSIRSTIEKYYLLADSIRKELFPEIYAENKVNPQSLRIKIWQEYRKRGEYPICHICGEEIRSLDELEIDHIIPSSLGGADTPLNLRPAHKHCNRIKSADILPTTHSPITILQKLK